MNTTKLTTLRDPEVLQARFALRVTAQLAQHAERTPHDVTERLRFARERALERARQVRRSAAVEAASNVQSMGGAAALSGGGRSPWWLKLASFAPLVLLLAGLSLIEQMHDRNQIAAAAEIDVALLADDLPPDAYRDAGFVEFLKTSQE
ncbi:DUF3619 family protein [Ideonella sp. BN130291]|uniref:DUF3619 family protein n=1 Tax=Ideonella sp. BN130291 TaxID=3112940 RepID=UPI002E26926D|nr:DUF3619 family protein [Ideonella sp. BN130291]